MKDLTGKKFGELTAIKPIKRGGASKKIVWECKCDCGNVVQRVSSDLLSGRTYSCGCKKRDKISKKAKEGWGEAKKDLMMQDKTNVTLMESNTVFVTSSTGVRGVNKDGQGKYRARLRFQGKTYTKRGFDTIEDAKKEREKMYEEIVKPYLKSIGRA